MIYKSTINFNLSEFALLFFCMSVVVFPNGSLVMQIMKVLFAALSFLAILLKGELRINTHLKWLIAVTLLSVLSLAWALDSAHALKGIFTIVLNFVVLFFLIQLFYYTKRWRNIVYFCLIVGPMLRFIYVMGEVGLVAFGGLRNCSYSGYNTLGMFAAVAIIFAYAAFYIEKIWLSKSVFFTIVTINFSILLISTSRKALIYLIIPVIVYCLLVGKSAAKRFKITILMLFISLIAIWAFLNIEFLYDFAGKGMLDLVQHFLNIGVDESAAGRDARITVGLELFKKRPWLGYGVMNFNYLFGKIENTDLLVADNNYIEVLVSYGIVGFIIYYSYFILLLAKLGRTIKTNNKLNLMMYGLLLAFLICDYGVSSYTYLHVQLLLCVICITLDNGGKTIQKDNNAIALP